MKLVVLLLCCAGCNAQFSIPTVDATGMTVWFSTTRSLRGMPESSGSKVYSASAQGVQFVAESTKAGVVEYRLAQVSDDGGVTLWVSKEDPSVRAIGISGPFYEYTSTVRRAADGREWSRAGEAIISRNGRWVRWSQNIITDLETGKEYSWPNIFYLGLHIADDGSSLAMRSDGQAGVQRPEGNFVPLVLGPGQFVQDIDRHASLVLATQYLPGIPYTASRLYLIDVDSGRERVLLEQCLQCFAAQLSGDGSLVMTPAMGVDPAQPWLPKSQIWAIRTLSGETQQLTDEPAGVMEAAISSDGRRVCYSGLTGAVRCVDTQGGTPQEFVKTTAFGLGVPFPLAPGARHAVKGPGMLGATVRIDDADVLVVPQSRSTRVDFVMPRESEPGEAWLEIDQPESPFEPFRARMPVVYWAPRAVVVNDLMESPLPVRNWPFLENGTRGGFANEEVRLLPGEEVWIHVTGFGLNPEWFHWRWIDAAVYPLDGVIIEEEEGNPGWQLIKVRIPEGALSWTPTLVATSPDDERGAFRIDIPVQQH